MSIIKKVLKGITNPNLTPISGTDAAFLYAESPNSPMHVGALTIVEGSLSFNDFKDVLAARIHKLPRFRQRLVSVPFNIDYPYWTDDPNFDIDLHLHRTALPSPKDWNTLRSTASDIFSTPLDLRRPLWSIHFVENLDAVSQLLPGSVCIITKMHHVMVDGVSGMGIMDILYDIKAKTLDEINHQSAIFEPAPLPNDISVFLNSYVGFLKNPIKLPKAAGQVIIKSIKSKAAEKISLGNNQAKSRFSVPKTIFNDVISPKRKWGSAILSFKRVKVLKDKMDVSLNDVILAICSGAIRKYLTQKNKLPAKSLVANVPISTRTSSEKGDLNNQISNMLVPLATNVEDPIERLELIHEFALQGKSKHKAMGAKTLSAMADAVPFGLANLAAGVYTRYNLTKLHNPLFNVTITNVPGPQIPLYLLDHKVTALMGMGPLVDGLGLIIAVLSYNGNITISPTSDAKTMPDIDVFCRFIRDSANELEEVILAKETLTEKSSSSKADAFFEGLKGFLREYSDEKNIYNGLFQFHITGENPTDWQLNLNRSPAIVKRGIYKAPDTIITVTDRHLNRIASRDIGMTEAKIQGRIKVDDINGKFENLAGLVDIWEANQNNKKRK